MIWRSYNIYVDLETGEQITKAIYTAEYYTVRKRKTTAQPDKAKGKVILTWIHECRKTNILELWTNKNMTQNIRATEQRKEKTGTR